MRHRSLIPEKDYKTKLKWLMFFRIIFSALLLASTIVLQQSNTDTSLGRSFGILYGLIVAIFFISLIYSLLLKRIKNEIAFAFIQTSVDTFFVMLIIYDRRLSKRLHLPLSGSHHLFEHAASHARNHDHCSALQPSVWRFS